MMLWGNLNHDYNEASMGYTSNLSWADYGNRGWSVPHAVVYMESHDEERLMYKNLEFGNSAGSYSVKDFNTALRRQELVSAFFYTIPGPKMLWQFGELGYDFSINYCEGGGVSENCRLDRKPVRWDYFQDEDRRRLFEITRGLIHFKTDYPVTNTTDYSLDVAGSNKRIHLNHAEFNTVVLGIFGVTSSSITPDFQSTGMWYDYTTGDSIMVTNTSAPIMLEAGEYRLYTSKPLAFTQDILSSDEEVNLPVSEVAIFPNPSQGPAQLQFSLNETSRVKVEVYATDGRLLQTLTEEQLPSGKHIQDLPANRLGGLYFIKLTTPQGSLVRKWMVH